MNFKEFEDYIIMEIIENSPEYKTLLKKQYEGIEVSNRNFTGHGFYTDFIVHNIDASLGENISLTLGNIQLRLNNSKNCTDYILFIKNGYISCLEGFAYNEDWPQKISHFEKI